MNFKNLMLIGAIFFSGFSSYGMEKDEDISIRKLPAPVFQAPSHLEVLKGLHEAIKKDDPRRGKSGSMYACFAIYNNIECVTFLPWKFGFWFAMCAWEENLEKDCNNFFDKKKEMQVITTYYEGNAPEIKIQYAAKENNEVAYVKLPSLEKEFEWMEISAPISTAEKIDEEGRKIIVKTYFSPEEILFRCGEVPSLKEQTAKKIKEIIKSNPGEKENILKRANVEVRQAIEELKDKQSENF